MFFVLEKRGLKNGEKRDVNVAFYALFLCFFAFVPAKDMLSGGKRYALRR